MTDHSHGPEAAFRRWGYAAEREQQRRARAVRDLFPDTGAPTEINDGDQRFTTPDTDVWCRGAARVEAWDLDVAACDESHLAPRYYTKADDGLTQPWTGCVWCNPPFSDIEPWVVRAWKELLLGQVEVVGVLLPASRTEQPWWHRWVEPFRDGRNPAALPDLPRTAKQWPLLTTHFLPGRTRFGHPGNPRGVGVGSPPFGCVLLVFREDGGR